MCVRVGVGVVEWVMKGSRLSLIVFQRGVNAPKGIERRHQFKGFPVLE